jgi:type III secretion protein V
VRAGVLTATQAQQRRQALEQECHLHGAMDGAMKFVKGDAIASIVIAMINILAGIAIGTLMRDMSLAGALQRYAILTVGDGMVSQIPSLLVSIAAGIVITRVGTGEQGDAELARQIGWQLSAHPRALVVAGLAVASFLFVPGFPKWVFGLLAAILVGLGLALRLRRERRRTSGWISHRGGAVAEAVDGDHAIAAPLALRLAGGLRAAVDPYALDRHLATVKAALEADLGPVFPRLQLAYVEGLPPHRYQVLVHDVVVEEGTLAPGRLLLDATQAGAAPAGAEVAEPFGPFARVVWVPGAQAGVRTWNNEEVLGRHLDYAVRRNVRELIGLQEVQRLLHSVQRDAPELAAEVARAAPAQRIAEVLRRLLQEGIPIRNLHAIFEGLVIWAPREQDPIALTELVRIHLGRYITSRYVGSSRRLAAILFEPSLLERVHDAVERSPRGNLLLLSPAVAQDVREQVRGLLGSAAHHVVAVASSDVRRYVKTLIEPVAPQLPVLSYQEVDEDVALQPVGWVTNPQVH